MWRGVSSFLGASDGICRHRKLGTAVEGEHVGGEHVGQPDQVVCGRLQLKHPAYARKATQPGLCHAAHALDPAIGLLDPLADDLARLVAAVAGGPAIDGGTALPVEALRPMGRDCRPL